MTMLSNTWKIYQKKRRIGTYFYKDIQGHLIRSFSISANFFIPCRWNLNKIVFLLDLLIVYLFTLFLLSCFSSLLFFFVLYFFFVAFLDASETSQYCFSIEFCLQSVILSLYTEYRYLHILHYTNSFFFFFFYFFHINSLFQHSPNYYLHRLFHSLRLFYIFLLLLMMEIESQDASICIKLYFVFL